MDNLSPDPTGVYHDIAWQVARYDERRALGITHDRDYAIKMEQYRQIVASKEAE